MSRKIARDFKDVVGEAENVEFCWSKWFKFVVDDGKTLKQLHDRHFSPATINYEADVHRYLLSVWMPLRLIFSSLKFSSFTIVFN